MTKRGKMQRVMLGTLAVMMVVSLMLAVMAFAAPAPASAAGPGYQPLWECYGYVCWFEPICWVHDPMSPFYACSEWCVSRTGVWRCLGASACVSWC